MKILNLLLVVIFASVFFTQCKSQNKENKKENIEKNIKEITTIKGTLVEIETSMGNMKVKLYDETPEHKKNFLKLVDEKFYDGIIFHRVIENFMIQAGDPDSKTATKGQALGSGGPGYTIPAEFNSKFIHKKGALSAARTGDQVNPEKRSSGSQFYIVQGTVYNDAQLAQMESQSEMGQIVPHIRKYLQDPVNAATMKEFQALQNAKNQKGVDSLVNIMTTIVKKEHPEIKGIKYTSEQKEIYKTLGGTPHLDANYTVFGEVVEGFEIIDKIASVEKGEGDRPVEDIKIISVKVVK